MSIPDHFYAINNNLYFHLITFQISCFHRQSRLFSSFRTKKDEKGPPRGEEGRTDTPAFGLFSPLSGGSLPRFRGEGVVRSARSVANVTAETHGELAILRGSGRGARKGTAQYSGKRRSGGAGSKIAPRTDTAESPRSPFQRTDGVSDEDPDEIRPRNKNRRGGGRQTTHGPGGGGGSPKKRNSPARS
jgi:hypothetical protein